MQTGERKQLTVAELIEALLEIENQDLPVYTEGCDCWGDAGSVSLNEDGRSVLIERR